MLVCFFTASEYVSAQPNKDTPNKDKPMPSDIRLVLDISGSMQQNDPANLRKPSIELLMQLLPEKSKAGVWLFAEESSVLVKHEKVSKGWRENGKKKAANISSNGLYTNIGEALESAAYDKDSLDSSYRTSIILLTDGMVDIDKKPTVNAKEWRRIVDEVLPELKEAGYIIHTVALSDNADKNLMNKLSLQTDGLAEVAHSADDLMKIFLKAFDAAAPTEQVPLSDNSFIVDSSIEEFTALIFKENKKEKTALTGPDGTVYSKASHSKDVNWYAAENYDLITVSQPLEGAWGVNADMGEGSRVTIVSNLNLSVQSLPNNVFVGYEDNANVMLKEDGKTITRSQFLKLMDVSATVRAGKTLTNLQTIWNEDYPRKKVPRGGRYTFDLPKMTQVGVYELEITVDGKSFKREFIHRFNVREPFGASIEKRFVDGAVRKILKVESYNANIDINKARVVASVKNPLSKTEVVTLSLTNMDTWEATLLPDELGKYYVDVSIKSYDLAGEKIAFDLETIMFKYDSDGKMVKEEKAFELKPKNKDEPEQKDIDDTQEPPVEEPQVAPQEAKSDKDIAQWILYSILGLANLILFGVGYFVVKKIFGKNSEEDVLEEFSEQAVEKAIAETSPEDATEPADEDIEPPMEDLDAIDTEEVVVLETEEVDDTSDAEPPMEDISLDPEPEANLPEEDEIDIDALLSEQASDTQEDDGLDDLDEMAAEEELDPDVPDQEADDEMVDAMLKAQGLDLSSDEMDDAINSLIDDLEPKKED